MKQEETEKKHKLWQNIMDILYNDKVVSCDEKAEELLKVVQSEIDLALANRNKELVELIKSNSKGSFTDDGGNDCWYIDDLVDLITKDNE